MLEPTSTTEVIRNILRLRRAERAAGEPAVGEISAVREFLEALVGSTVLPAEAARLLGISQPSLNRWLDGDEISTVMTPGGRREIPLSELVQLLEDVEAAREQGERRPVARVIKNRNRESIGTVDIDRLLPRRAGRGHRTAELQSLAYHRLVADRLDDGIVADARRRLGRWRSDGRVDPRWVAKWDDILGRPLSQIAKAISADTPRARELRQTSPFAGVLTPQERRRLVDAVEERAAR
jgi:excisionase family DNA binding protein